ncbi:MAG TPA: hydrogenase maturation protease [Syntrophales bacterium]|nr:hydrogenase maturation protease [Syntrophales bacterium]
MKTLVLGMGNPILSDDAVGLALVEILKKRINRVDFAAGAMIGLSLFDLIVGYDTVFIIDAMTTREGKIGGWKKVCTDDKCGTLHLFSSHGLNIFELMELGVRCGLPMPRLAAVYGIEIGNDVAFAESISPELSEILPAIAHEIIGDMRTLLPALSESEAE